MARERARQEREARHRAWAQGIVDSYEADLTAADAAIQTAQDRFLTIAVEQPASAATAYLAWADAANQHYIVQVRLASVAPLVGIEATPPEHAEVPPFSQALDDALARHIAIRADQARDKAAAEIEAKLDTDD